MVCQAKYKKGKGIERKIARHFCQELIVTDSDWLMWFCGVADSDVLEQCAFLFQSHTHTYKTTQVQWKSLSQFYIYTM